MADEAYDDPRGRLLGEYDPSWLASPIDGDFRIAITEIAPRDMGTQFYISMGNAGAPIETASRERAFAKGASRYEYQMTQPPPPRAPSELYWAILEPRRDIVLSRPDYALPIEHTELYAAAAASAKAKSAAPSSSSLKPDVYYADLVAAQIAGGNYYYRHGGSRRNNSPRRATTTKRSSSSPPPSKPRSGSIVALSSRKQRSAVFAALDRLAQMVCVFRLAPRDYGRQGDSVDNDAPFLFVEYIFDVPDKMSAIKRIQRTAAKSSGLGRIGFITRQHIDVPSVFSTDRALHSRVLSRSETDNIWYTPQHVVLPNYLGITRDKTLPRPPNAIPYDLIYNLKPYMAWTLPGYEMNAGKFDWPRAVLLGAGAHGKVVRVAFTANAQSSIAAATSTGTGAATARDNNTTNNDSGSAILSIEAAIRNDYSRMGWQLSDRTHLVVALKALSPFGASPQIIALYKGEASAGIVLSQYHHAFKIGSKGANLEALAKMGFTPPQLKKAAAATAAASGAITIDNRFILPHYGWVIKDTHFGIVSMLAPFELGEAVELAQKEKRAARLYRSAEAARKEMVSYERLPADTPGARDRIVQLRLDIASREADAMSIAKQVAAKRMPFNLLSVPTMVRVLYQLAHAIAWTAECGFIHRDIKPGNILLDAQGSVLLADYGFAIPIGATAFSMGTPMFMPKAQEATAGSELLTYTNNDVDLYAFAVTTREILDALDRSNVSDYAQPFVAALTALSDKIISGIDGGGGGSGAEEMTAQRILIFMDALRVMAGIPDDTAPLSAVDATTSP
ncbi:MAG: protein kinase [Candidatus Paceibacterota bacterium]|jgi:hypothetical protein